MKKKSRGNPIPLVVESHPTDYDGYPFITLIQYTRQHFLTLADNTNEKVIYAFILDLCGPSGVNEEQVIDVATYWWDHNRAAFPLSFEFSRRYMTDKVSPIYRGFNVEFVTRVIGPLPKFTMDEVHSVRRRKRKPVPPGMEVHFNATSSQIES